MAHAEQVRIGRRDGAGEGTRGFGEDTVGHTHWAPSAVVLACTKPAGGGAERGVDIEGIEQAELGEIEGDIFLIASGDAHQLIEYLAEAYSGQHSLA